MKKQSKPIGILVLIVLNVINIFVKAMAILGVIFAATLLKTMFKGFIVDSQVGLFIGFLFFLCMIFNLYHLLNPNEFGWKFIMVSNALGLSNTILTSKASSSTILSIVLSLLVITYIYSKRDYFVGKGSETKIQTLP